jgi:MFS family permease
MQAHVFLIFITYLGRSVMQLKENEQEVFIRKQPGFKFHSTIVMVYLFVLTYLQLTIAGPDSMNILMPALVGKFGMNPGQIMGSIASTRLIGVVAAFILGTMIMKFGFRKVGIPSIIISGICVAMTGRVGTFSAVVYIQIMLAILTPSLLIIQGGLVANWFVRYKGRVFGLVTIGAPLSAATFTPIGMKIYQSVGFASFYMGLGAIVAVVGIIGFYAMKEKPEDFGCDPDGIPFTDEERAEFEALREENKKTDWPFKRLMKSKEFWCISLAWGLIGGLMMAGIMSQVIAILTGAGVSLDRSLGMMSIACLAGMPLSYVWGWLDDKIGTPKTNALFTCTSLFGALGFAYGTADNMAVLYIALFCIALGVGGGPNLQPSIIAYVFGRKEFVNVFRYATIITAILQSVGMTYLAVMNDKFGSYSVAFKTFIPISILCGLMLLSVKKSYDPERLALQDHGDSK